VFYNTPPGAKPVPDVRGMSVTDAESTLSAAGFKSVNQNPNRYASLKIPNGRVFSTTPVAGTKVSPTTVIVLNLSGGGDKVPYVIYERAAEAAASITAAHLTPIITKQPGPPGATPGTVWQTKPGPDSVQLPGTAITLFVVPGSTSPSPSPSSTSTSPSTSPTSSPSGSPSQTPSPHA
jgi:beta-lactam-binding protein with PASTA domain